MRSPTLCAVLVAALVPAAWSSMAAVIGADYGLPPSLMGGQPALGDKGAGGDRLRAGIDALAKGDLDAARANFRAAAQADPTAPLPLLGLAEVAMRRGDRKEAEAQIKKALDVAPGSALVHSSWAHYLVTQKDYWAALAELDKAAELDPQSSGPHDQKGDIYATALHEPNKAITAYREALAIDPNDASARYALGNALAETGKLSDAKSELVKATELAPKNPLGWMALGTVTARMGDNGTALAAFDTALKLDPRSVAAHVGRGDVLAGQGRTEEAITAYKSALKTNGRSAPTLVRLAVTEQKAKRPAEAEKSYRAVLAIDPQEPIATNNLAFLLADERRQLDDALRLATRAVEHAPASENALDTLAWVRRARGELPVAANILEPLAGSTKDPALLYHLGVVYSEMGKKREAIVAFDNALKLAPDYQPAREARQKLAGSAR